MTRRSRPLLALLCFTFCLLSTCLRAEDFDGIAQRIFTAGEGNGVRNYLQFLDGELRQYAVAERSLLTGELESLRFIEERWSKSGDRDIIDQWIVEVVPRRRAMHSKLVERGAIVLDIQPLSAEGAEVVARRIAEKASSDSPTPATTVPQPQ
jgi:hypothetical protein